jgi:methanol metabolism-related c-type cytochrome
MGFFALSATLGMTACGAEDQPPAAKDESGAATAAAPGGGKVADAGTAPAAAPKVAEEKGAVTAETAPAEPAPAAAGETSPKAEGAPETTPGSLKPKVEKVLMAGMWRLPNGSPTFNVVGEGEGEERIIKKVDWYTYSGWRRYHAECHVCHGPNAKGSTYAPALADSLKAMPYEKFLQVVASGQERDVGGTKFIMPALGDNKNVMCYIDDLYIYLKARASGELPPGRLSADQRDEKPQEAKDNESACLGS